MRGPDKSVAFRPDLWESIKSLSRLKCFLEVLNYERRGRGFGKLENGDSNSQSAGFELLRRSCAGRSRRPWSPPCRARHEAAPETGPGGSRFRASGGTGLLPDASLRRAGTDGLRPETQVLTATAE